MSAGGGDGVGEQVEADGAGELLLCEQLRRLRHRAAPGGGHRGGTEEAGFRIRRFNICNLSERHRPATQMF